MFTLYHGDGKATVYLSPQEPSCVAYAVNDLLSDVRKVGGCALPLVRGLPDGGDAPRLVIGTLTTPSFRAYASSLGVDTASIDGKWEHYLMQTVDSRTMLIAGSDERGAMWGVYEFCQRFLHVDPLYWWTDHEPQPISALEIPATLLTDGPHTYRFRGWFINDEDLIRGMCRKGAPSTDRSFQADYPPLLNRIIEAALRLKQNLLIPCSFLDIEKPSDERLVQMVTERGLFISMHHQEPVGVHQHTLDAYWKARGVENINFVDDEDKYVEVWTRYIRHWAQYPHVIWQLGLRGRGDRPVWYQNDSIPQTTQARGALISHAIQTQLAIIRRECGDQPILSTSTLWMEGMPLYKAGALSFPDETMIVMSDFGPDQMWGEGYDTAPRLPGHGYGVYYHLAFWGCGPHLIQGNRPEKIHFNFAHAAQLGDTRYCIINVSNVREFVCGIRYTARITWNMADADPDAFLTDWCAEQFSAKYASVIAGIYRDYFAAFPSLDDRLLDRRMQLMDGMCRRVAMQLISIIQGAELTQPDIQNKRLFAFDSTDDFISWYRQATQEGMVRFTSVCQKAAALLPLLPTNRQDFFTDNLLTQAQVILSLFRWVHALACAAQLRRSDNDTAAYTAQVEAAVEAVREAIEARGHSAHGKWKDWYADDSLMNFDDMFERTKALLALSMD